MTDELSKGKHQRPLTGVEVWKNPRNNFTVVQIHYTADPAKRAPEWRAQMKASMPRRDWEREYEMSWETWNGLPVYTDFSEEVHAVDDAIMPHLGLPLLRGWDFGLTPAAIVCQLQEETLAAIYEFVAFNMGIERFSDIVLQQCAVLFPSWRDKRTQWCDFIDPAGFARAQTDEKTCASVLQSKGLNPVGGAVNWEARRKSVDHFLTYRTNRGPGFKVSRANCPLLVQGFKGGYQYPEDAGVIEPAKLRPLKNKYSHIHDGLQMVTSKLRDMKPGRLIKPPPALSYGFTRGR
jgi:hypothetical protein